MTMAVRIIPRLDVKGPNLVKGLCFDGYRVLGHPQDFAHRYYAEGADEILYVDTVASLYRRAPMLDVIRRIAAEVFVPITVAGGIRSLNQIREILRAGADKVAINTAAIATPDLLKEAVRVFGSQCIVASIEAQRNPAGGYECWTDYGRQPTGIDAFEWARRVVDLGVGEILLSAVHCDGLGEGFDLELTAAIAEAAPVPVIASCGAGGKDDFRKVIVDGRADAVAAASVFHYRIAVPPETPWMSYAAPDLRMGAAIDAGNIEFLKDGYGGLREFLVAPLGIEEVKRHLADNGVAVRLDGVDPALVAAQ